MHILKSTNALDITGSDAYTFVDSLVSNSINENEIKFSYLLGPDGKVKFWFIFTFRNNEVKIFQTEENLLELKKLFEKYKIRINCELNILKDNTFFEISNIDETLMVQTSAISEKYFDWFEIEIMYELPSLNIIEMGLLPNEIKWLESFVDFYKGCFMGQEQASRVNFRGKPRRILKSISDSTQEIVRK